MSAAPGIVKYADLVKRGAVGPAKSLEGDDDDDAVADEDDLLLSGKVTYVRAVVLVRVLCPHQRASLWCFAQL